MTSRMDTSALPGRDPDLNVGASAPSSSQKLLLFPAYKRLAYVAWHQLDRDVQPGAIGQDEAERKIIALDRSARNSLTAVMHFVEVSKQESHPLRAEPVNGPGDRNGEAADRREPESFSLDRQRDGKNRTNT